MTISRKDFFEAAQAKTFTFVLVPNFRYLRRTCNTIKLSPTIECVWRCARIKDGRGTILLSRGRTDSILALVPMRIRVFLVFLTGPDVEGALAMELINASPSVKNYGLLVTHLLNHR